LVQAVGAGGGSQLFQLLKQMQMQMQMKQMKRQAMQTPQQAAGIDVALTGALQGRAASSSVDVRGRE
jgi:hypothetical protein